MKEEIQKTPKNCSRKQRKAPVPGELHNRDVQGDVIRLMICGVSS
jgi:hypothetical protein